MIIFIISKKNKKVIQMKTDLQNDSPQRENKFSETLFLPDQVCFPCTDFSLGSWMVQPQTCTDGNWAAQLRSAWPKGTATGPTAAYQSFYGAASNRQVVFTAGGAALLYERTEIQG